MFRENCTNMLPPTHPHLPAERASVSDDRCAAATSCNASRCMAISSDVARDSVLVRTIRDRPSRLQYKGGACYPEGPMDPEDRDTSHANASTIKSTMLRKASDHIKHRKVSEPNCKRPRCAKSKGGSQVIEPANLFDYFVIPP